MKNRVTRLVTRVMEALTAPPLPTPTEDDDPPENYLHHTISELKLLVAHIHTTLAMEPLEGLNSFFDKMTEWDRGQLVELRVRVRTSGRVWAEEVSLKIKIIIDQFEDVWKSGLLLWYHGDPGKSHLIPKDDLRGLMERTRDNLVTQIRELEEITK